MDNNNKQRSSNYELLRIVAMFLIIVHHISYHCAKPQFQSSELFSSPALYKRLWLLDFGSLFGPMCNAIFILLSGYFMIEKKEINLEKIAKKLLLQFTFSIAVLVFGTFAIWNVGVDSRYGINNLANIFYYNSNSWFISYYLLVIVTAKLFLNSFLQKRSKKEYLDFLLVLFAMVQMVWTGQMIDSFMTGFRVFATGVFMYSFGGYMRRFNPFKNVKTIVLVLGLFLDVIIVCVSSYNINAPSIKNHVLSGGLSNYSQQFMSFENYSIVAWVAAILLCELFGRLNIGCNRLINYFGGATFMVYLIHDNPVFYSKWKLVDWDGLLSVGVMQYLLYLVKHAGMTFALGVSVYFLYNIICKLCIKYKRLVLIQEK